DEGANALLTQNLQKKLRAAGIEDPTAKAEFVVEGRPKSMLIDYRGVKNRASWCPVRITGKPETKLLAWNVGLGNSTGIGFGAIK
ncbi:CRISPR-associated endoribonuclease Cas6, partial [Bacteroides heparinolyticus]